MSQYDPDLDRQRPLQGESVYTETVIVRRESNTGWWIAGGLAALILIAVLWILFARSTPTADDTEARLAEAQAAQAVAEAQASSNAAAVQGQIAGGQQSIELARVDAARAQAEAQRASSEARAAEARAVGPAIITAPATPSSPPPSGGVAVITPTSPQP
ncbi:MAG TPA: hypothetical protein VF633_05530 [Brevundimonas sp.]